MHPIVHAYLSDAANSLREAVNRLRPHDPVLPCARAILSATLALDQNDPNALQEAFQTTQSALQRLPSDRSLFFLMVTAAIACSIRLHKLAEARQALRLLEGVPMKGFSPELRAMGIHSEMSMRLLNGDVAGAFDCANRALALARPKTRTWCRLKLLRSELAVQTGYVFIGGQDIADIEKHGANFLRPADRRDLAFAKGWLLHCSGTPRSALELYESLSPDADQGKLTLAVATALVQLERFDEARAKLESAGSRLSPFNHHFLSARVALACRDLDSARLHAQALVRTEPFVPLIMYTGTRLLAVCALTAGQPAQARRLLQAVDREGNDPVCLPLWFRLSLLERNEPRAVELLRQWLARAPVPAIMASLQFAHEMSLPAFTRALAASGSAPAALAAPPAPRPSPAPPAQAKLLLGESPVMGRVRAQIGKFAPLDTTVLLTGETGTGKELAARLLHDSGPRKVEPFVAVNCAALTDTLLEAELFGFARGAFTGADREHDGLFVAAGKGTLFLDEVAEVSPRLQGVLLRVLENREIRPVGATHPRAVPARVVAASNRSLETMVKAGTFREDLYYRLVRLEIRLPALRERTEDIPLLVRHFLDVTGRSDLAVGNDLMAELRRRPWPGNVRELRNEIERLAILAEDRRVLGADILRPEDPRPVAASPAASTEGQTGPRMIVRIRDRVAWLRKLFNEHGRMTVANVIAALGCSPPSARRYLTSLTKEGYIRRVITSGHLRTSYFVRTEGPGHQQ